MEITGAGPAAGSRKLLAKVGLDRDMAHRNVMKLFGGQQQRMAIIRALACDVGILFEDEPTGNLDEETAEDIVKIFKELAHEQNQVRHRRHPQPGPGRRVRTSPDPAQRQGDSGEEARRPLAGTPAEPTTWRSDILAFR
ncbi:ATP-binding cassette domain-containing protein [Streptomyces shenzhenensis]|uniref:ATP-binding cassette domain-containing protein n=1 Tax=Streptomyces shenzhenensis TaxID=943815 RepID=UPI001F309AA6|nr:ATP-binding cassette domain-containing protein [Streptomyces shenzhenensis]